MAADDGDFLLIDTSSDRTW